MGCEGTTKGYKQKNYEICRNFNTKQMKVCLIYKHVCQVDYCILGDCKSLNHQVLVWNLGQ
jgi:hypothetical protein